MKVLKDGDSLLLRIGNRDRAGSGHCRLDACRAVERSTEMQERSRLAEIAGVQYRLFVYGRRNRFHPHDQDGVPGYLRVVLPDTVGIRVRW